MKKNKNWEKHKDPNKYRDKNRDSNKYRDKNKDSNKYRDKNKDLNKSLDIDPNRDLIQNEDQIPDQREPKTQMKTGKRQPNIVVFLVEGISDQNALELPLAGMILDKHPEYIVRFLLQERRVNNLGDDVDDSDEDDEDDEFDDSDDSDYVYEEEREYGGDITSASYVVPDNIETKITNRFIKPAIKKHGVYAKKIARVIHIVDLDGAYIPDECILQNDACTDGPFYNEDGSIETNDIPSIVDRNARKRKNLEHLLTLTDKGIKIKSKRIPYELYFFSSNLDHFISNNANVIVSKRKNALDFYAKHGVTKEKFCKFFFDDPNSIGRLGYKESWEEIKKGINSVKRFTNIDYLIRQLLDME